MSQTRVFRIIDTRSIDLETICNMQREGEGIMIDSVLEEAGGDPAVFHDGVQLHITRTFSPEETGYDHGITGFLEIPKGSVCVAGLLRHGALTTLKQF